MTERDEGQTDRWLGVFRSAGRQPMSAEQFAQVQVHRRLAVRHMMIGAALVAFPLVLLALFILSCVQNDSSGVVLISGIVTPVIAASVLASGVSRYRHLRAIEADGEVELFEGTLNGSAVDADARAPGDRLPGEDAVTQRLLRTESIVAGRPHRLTVHPETGLVLAVDGMLVKRLVGGDVTITARLAPAPVDQEALDATRPLSALEKQELAMMRRRLVRLDGVTPGGWLGASGVLVVGALVFGLNPSLVSAATAALALLVTAGVVALTVRARCQELWLDAETGLRRDGDRWVLSESGRCWEAYGQPGPVRLARGGLGAEADGTARPMSF